MDGYRLIHADDVIQLLSDRRNIVSNKKYGGVVFTAAFFKECVELVLPAGINISQWFIKE